MVELYLIRHGQTAWNVEGRYTGQSDIPLNENGRSQASSLADQLRQHSFTMIYSSDLQRALHTAQALAQATGSPLQVDRRLREIDQGEWEGKLFSEIRSNFAQAWKDRVDNPLHAGAPGGETLQQVQDRVMECLDQILNSHKHGDQVAIVAHGLVLALVKVHFGGLPIRTVWDNIPDNARPDILRVDPA